MTNDTNNSLKAGDDVLLIAEKLMGKVIDITDDTVTVMVLDDEGMTGVGTYTVEDIMFFNKNVRND